jgi:hypothetical protein
MKSTPAHLAAVRRYRKKHKAQISLARCTEKSRSNQRVRSARYRATSHGKFRTYVDSARVRNINFVLTFDEFVVLLNSDCVYCGVPNSGGIDRRCSSDGYTLENAVGCCTVCNYMKLDYSDKEFLDQVERIHKYQEELRG